MVSIEFSNESEDNASVVSPLRTMERLKCSPDKQFVHTEFDEQSNEYRIALHTYQQHVTHALGGRDSNNRIREAQEYIRDLRNSEGVTVETKRLLAHINNLVRNKNNFVIKTILKQKKINNITQGSLFGIDYDVNAWVETTFSNLAHFAVEQRGESKLAVYITK